MAKHKKSTNAIMHDTKDVTLKKEARAFFAQDFKMPYDPEHHLVETKERIMNREKSPEAYRAIDQAITTLGFDNDYILVSTTSTKYGTLSVELRRQLIKNFNCTTHAEKILIDMVVSAYIRTLQCNRAFSAHLNRDSFSATSNTYLSIVSKELDRANRHLLAAYQTLVELKHPPLEIQIKSKNTFIAQAQQFNATDQEKRYE